MAALAAANLPPEVAAAVAHDIMARYMPRDEEVAAAAQLAATAAPAATQPQSPPAALGAYLFEGLGHAFKPLCPDAGFTSQMDCQSPQLLA